MLISFPDHLHFFFCVNIFFFKHVQKPPGNLDITCLAIGTLGFLVFRKKKKKRKLGRTKNQVASLRKGLPLHRSGYAII